MNTDTGKIIDFEAMKELSEAEQAKYVSIDELAMTLKQKRDKQVSVHDNRSPLGKLRIKHKNSLRNKPCPCGSGIKFKKCCWDKVE